MLQDVQELYGNKLGAADGEIGHVRDFYFDDTTWAVRYLVVDTGSWLSGRQVLLPPDAFAPHAIDGSAADAGVLRVNLTRKQIEDSPPIAAHRPVSRPYEEEFYRYYGWPGAVAGVPVVLPPVLPPARPPPGHQQRDDRHLRSTKAVTGYQIQTIDGAIGSVSSFRVDGASWAIREVVGEAGPWHAGKSIRLRPESIDRISYEDSAVFVNLTKEDLQQTPQHDAAPAGAGRR